MSKHRILVVITLLALATTVYLHISIHYLHSPLPRSTQRLVTTYRKFDWNIRKISLQAEPVQNMKAPLQPSTNAHVRSFDRKQMRDEDPALYKRVIRILTWTYITVERPYWFDGRLKGEAQCNTSIPCVFSNDHSLYDVSDVILFHTRHALGNDAMPAYRLPHQHWISYLREPPVKSSRIERSHTAWFNWTIAYTMNADMVRPYGMCLPTREKAATDPGSITDAIRLIYGNAADSIPWENGKIKHQYTPINYAESKTRKVLWVVSHCRTPSKRERYVHELKRHIDIDIIGKCGDDVCKKHDSCIKHLYRNHKFYLAFENSLCADYITEKVWRGLREGIVPIVLGRGDYKSYLPVHSYIDVKDFTSPKALASYLHELDKDDNLYNEYFAWKQNYTCHNNNLPGNSLLCNICRFMNENVNAVNIIPDINRFWSKTMCLPNEQYYGIMMKDL